MTTRHKLNSLHALVCLTIAIALGLAFGSCSVFAITLIAALAIKTNDGAIRLTRRRHDH